ncbi:hypothetical protein GQX74_004329 [Glossina fuscipes]|nr:hypothetical protein GQX74_004329 [Glossina fuscipes]
MKFSKKHNNLKKKNYSKNIWEHLEVYKSILSIYSTKVRYSRNEIILKTQKTTQQKAMMIQFDIKRDKKDI